MLLPEVPMRERIKKGRADRGLSVAQLAQLIGVTPAYLYRLEKGVQIPSVAVAMALASQLGESEQEFRAWAEAGRRAAPRLPQPQSSYRSAPLQTRGFTGQDIQFRRIQPGEALPDAPPGFLGPIAILDEGTDPAGEELPAHECLYLRHRAVPHEDRPVGGFAYRVGEQTVRRVKNRLEPGDLVVFSSETGPVKAGEIYAVRFEGRIVLSRLVSKGDLLLLPSDATDEEIEVIRLRDEPVLSHVVGRLVIVVRAVFEFINTQSRSSGRA